MMRAFCLALCAATGLAFLTVSAEAFQIQGENAEIPKSAAEHLGLSPTYSMPQFEGSSLAMPFANNGETSSFATDYGNSIAIPAPGVSQPTPAWQSGAAFR